MAHMHAPSTHSATEPMLNYPYTTLLCLLCAQEQSELAQKVADTEDSAAHRTPPASPHPANDSQRLKHSSTVSTRPVRGQTFGPTPSSRTQVQALTYRSLTTYRLTPY